VGANKLSRRLPALDSMRTQSFREGPWMSGTSGVVMTVCAVVTLVAVPLKSAAIGLARGAQEARVD